MEEFFARMLEVSSPWFIDRVDFQPDIFKIDVYIDFEKGSSFPSPDPAISGNHKVHDTKTKSWRDIDVHRCQCHIHCRVPRVMLPNGKVRIVQTPWEGRSKGFTVFFEAALIELCQQMPVSSAANFLGIDDNRAWRALRKYVDGANARRDLSGLEAVGMDETSSKKGHNYVSLFVDLSKRRTVFVADGKAEPVVARFAERLAEGGGDPGAVKWASCDMSPAFIAGVAKSLPNAEITFDRFHLMKIVNQSVDRVRREEAKSQPILAKARWAVLKNQSNLTIRQQAKRHQLEMSGLNLLTVKAIHARENLQSVYKADTEEGFKALLKEWVEWVEAEGPPLMAEATAMVRRHWDGIVSWKRSQINNGILEGFNSLVQAAKRKARGYRNTENFKTIIYLLTGKLNFKALNPHIRHIGGPLPHSN